MAGLIWNGDPLSVKGVVVPTVVELLTNTPADLEVQIGCHCHISRVKQAVDVAAQEKPIRCLMFAAVAVGANMCGL